MGGSSVLTVSLGIVRTKILALIVGPDGIGLYGILYSLCGFASAVASFGLQSSGVRQIAAAEACSDTRKLATVTRTLLTMLWAFGTIATAVIYFAAPQISLFTFGSAERAGDTALLSVSVLLTVVAAAGVAVLQGTRRVAQLASMNIVAALVATGSASLAAWLFPDRGVVLFLICVSASTAIVSLAYAHRFARSLHVEVPLWNWTEARPLLLLGFAFMASAMMTNGVAYFARTFVVRALGIEAAGLFQAAWMISSVYVGFILTAMAADYFPRLTAAQDNRSTMNRLVNEQTEVALLLAGPGVLLTITLAPYLLGLLYSSDFQAAADVLRWQSLGVFGRVLSWPMGYVLLARNSIRLFLITELLSTAVHIGLIYLGILTLGFQGLGVAFFGLYVVYTLMILFVINRETGFRWSRRVCWIAFGSAIALTLTFSASTILKSNMLRLLVPLSIALCSGVCCLWVLWRINEASEFTPAQRIAKVFRLSSRG